MMLFLQDGQGAGAEISGNVPPDCQRCKVRLTREMFVMRLALEGSGYSPPCATGFMRW